MKRTLEVERTYPHPIERVWFALTDADALSQWLMENDFKPVEGHEFTFQDEPQPGWDGTVECRVLEVDEPHRLQYTWKGGPLDTILTFELEEVDGGTRLRVEQTGFEGLKAVLVSFIFQLGNRRIYGEYLPELLDRVASGDFANGRSPEPHSSAIKKGIAHAADAVPGKGGK